VARFQEQDGKELSMHALTKHELGKKVKPPRYAIGDHVWRQETFVADSGLKTTDWVQYVVVGIVMDGSWRHEYRYMLTRGLPEEYRHMDVAAGAFEEKDLHQFVPETAS
jgi:hypothetical protein